MINAALCTQPLLEKETKMIRPHAVITGAGSGLSAAVARELSTDYDLTLAARNGEKVRSTAEKTGAVVTQLDGTDETAVAAL